MNPQFLVNFDDLIEKLRNFEYFAMDSQNLGEFSGTRRKKEEKVSILLESLFIQWILVLPSNSRTFTRKFRWSIIARQKIVTGWLRRIHLPRRESLRDALHYSKWTDPRRKKQQKGQTVSVLHSREPDRSSTWSKRNWIRSGQTQNRTVQTHLESSRKSDDPETEVHQHKETCGSDHCVDFRILGIPHSAVEQVEANRLFEQFESHPNRHMLLKDFE